MPCVGQVRTFKWSSGYKLFVDHGFSSGMKQRNLKEKSLKKTDDIYLGLNKLTLYFIIITLENKFERNWLILDTVAYPIIQR